VRIKEAVSAVSSPGESSASFWAAKGSMASLAKWKLATIRPKVRRLLFVIRSREKPKGLPDANSPALARL
jgi:hypothetical protein